MELNYDKDSKERIPYEHYMELYRQADPREISGRCGIPYDEEKQEFLLRLMGVTYHISFPDYEAVHERRTVSDIIRWRRR